MNVFAYCTWQARHAVEVATGVTPLTSPPIWSESFDSALLEGNDLIYVRLHGSPTFPYTWYGESEGGGWIPALVGADLEGVDLGGAVVVLANCHSASSPLVSELYGAGAGTVIAGPGSNYAGGQRVIGTDKLVQWIIKCLKRGMSVRSALTLARVRLFATSWRAADRDALAFTII